VDSAPRWVSLFDGIDRLMLLLANRAERFMAPIRFQKELDYPLLCARGEREMNELLVFADKLGFFDIHTSVITVEGWRRIDELKKTQPRARQAFVAMSFAPEGDVVWSEGLKPGIEESNYYTAFRVDRTEHNDKLDDYIIANIRRSGLLVADFTGHRGGVYFEAGFALGLGIPVIWTCRSTDVDGLHFDTRQYNHIIWETPADLRRRLTDRILATVVPRGPV